MSTSFDPYYTWLGIPPAEQPPDHYRLLGLVRFEQDPNVIAYAADRQMAHLRSLQMGPQAEASQRLLNEVAAARVCLLDPVQKAAYDAQLQERSLAPGQPAGTPLAFDQYVLIDKLDSSRSGQVLKAKHATMGRVVALKILSREAMASAQFRERFQRKVRILAQLQHPNLVAAYEAGEFQGMYYLVMEYVDGQDLRSLVKEWGPPPVDKALDYICQAAEGLAYAHRQGVYHRDVKPANFLVDKRGTLKVIGLGLAHVEADSVLSEDGMGELTRQGQIMGTYDYMSPEQAVDSSRVDPRCDIYSLGCSLYAILTGRPPYLGKSPMQQVAAHREAPIPSLCAARPDVPAFLDAVFQRMVAKRPEDRYQSMDEVLVSLRGGVAPAVVPVAPVAAPAVLPVTLVAAPAVTLVSDGSGLDFLSQAKPASTAAKPAASRPTRPKGWSAALHNPIIRFYLIGSLVLLIVVAVLLFRSGKKPDQRTARKPSAESAPAEQAETRPEKKEDRSADREPAPAPAKAEQPEEPKFVAGKPTFIETDPLGTMIAPANRKPAPEPAGKPAFMEPDPFAPKTAPPKAKPAPKQPAKAKKSEPKQPATAAAESAPAKQAAAEPAPKAVAKIDSRPARRLPVPGDQELAAPRKLIRETFKDDLAKAQDSEAKAAMAQRLTERAQQIRDDVAGRYVCLVMAVDLATEAGRPTVAFEGIDRLAEGFDVDPLAMKAKVVTELVSTAKTAVQHTAAAHHALTVTEAALAAGDYELAAKTGRLAQAEATKSRDADITQKARSTMKDVQQGLKEFSRVEEAQAKLKERADDPEANALVGRYECLTKGRWAEGLQHLAAGSDAALGELAKTDLSGPTDPEAQVALADRWWDLADKETGAAKRNLRLHAATWYEKAMPHLKELVKMKAERRLETAAGGSKKAP